MSKEQLRAEYNKRVKATALRLNIDTGQLYRDLSALIINKFNLNRCFISVSDMSKAHFRYGLKILSEYY
jgi:hypothetical protein